MKHIKIISSGVFFFLFLTNLIGQEHGRWYNLMPKPKSQVWYAWSSVKASKEEVTSIKGIPNSITNLYISKIQISQNKDIGTKIKSELFGLRGRSKGRDILMIDANMNRNFDDDSLLILPILDLDPDIEYNNFYIYPTDSSFTFDVKYEIIKDNYIFTIPTRLSITVYAKYDTLTNTLHYLDEWKYGTKDNFELNSYFDDIPVVLYTSDALPWQTITMHRFRFKIQGDSTYRKIHKGDQIKINDRKSSFVIDSFDLLNKRVLIKKVKSTDEYINISGVSLFSSDTILIKKNSNYSLKVVHFWGPWCKPCIHNMPKLIKLKRQIPEIELIGVCLGKTKKIAQKVAQENKIDWKNIYLDFLAPRPEEFPEISSFPTYILVDKNNIILGRYYRFEQLEKKIHELRAMH